MQPIKRSKQKRYDLSLQRGFSLVEVLVSLLITLIVLGIVFRTAQMLVAIYRKESETAEKSAAAIRAFDDIAMEIARAGYGLGDGVQAVLPFVVGGSGSSSDITLRSNAYGAAANLKGELVSADEAVAVSHPELFQEGDKVLLTQAGGFAERAEVTDVGERTLAFRSLEGDDGELVYEYLPEHGARVVRLQEIGYSLEPAPEGRGNLLTKTAFDRSPRVLARNVEALHFVYLDDQGGPLSDDSLERTSLLTTVRITMTYSFGDTALDVRTLATAITLDQQSAGVDFAEPGYGMRLTRFFYPIAKPAGVATRATADWGVILSSGNDPSQDRSFLYSFLSETRLLEARQDTVTWLEDVRSPVALCFGPEKTSLAGSLFIAASGLRIGHLARVHPDEQDVFSQDSRVDTFDGTEALAQIGGIAFGLDGALYVTSQEKGAIFRFRFGPDGKPLAPKKVVDVKGSPRAIVTGFDGELYFLLDQANETSLWRLPFDESGDPEAPTAIGALDGQAVSLAADSLSGSLFVLVRERLGDTVVLELDSAWIAGSSKEPLHVFSLEALGEESMDGRSQDRETEAKRAATRLPSTRLAPILVPETLDFLAFDNLGFLYLGAREKGLVLKFDLDRPGSSRHIVNIAAATEAGSGKARLHAWRKNRLGS